MKAWPTAALLLSVVMIVGGCPSESLTVEGNPVARIATSRGEIVVELLPEIAPRTVENFTAYVDEQFYDGTIFHRVVPDFVIQGGGLLPDLTEKETRGPIANEANNGLSNLRGTIAMARTDDPDSATAQFFFNVADNTALDATLTSSGYAVFGVVREGLAVVDRIASVQTQTEGDFQDVPVEDVVIESIRIEAGETGLSPEWEAYIARYQYEWLVGLRSIAVNLLSSFISGS